MDWNLGRASQRSKDLNFDGLKFERASQRSDGVESWTCFSEVQRLNFGHAFQRSDGLKFGRASQRSDGLESWTCFPEVQGLNFGCASQRSVDLNLDVLPRGSMD